MRRILVLSIALLASPPALADEGPCDSYRSNTTGGDPACDAAIARETDAHEKSNMLFQRAYMEDAARNIATYPRALADLDEALRLWPENAVALRERGYLFNEYGRWKEALSDLDAYVRLKPAEAGGYSERAMARFGLGDLQGNYDDYAALAMLEPDVAKNLSARGSAAMWLGRFEDARKDFDAAAALAAKSGDKEEEDEIARRKTRLALWTRTSGNDPLSTCVHAKTEEEYHKPTFVGDCTRAFLDAKTGKDKADALTQRSMILPIVEQQRSAALPDAQLAHAFDPDNADYTFNLGSRLIDLGWTDEGLRYVEASMKAGPTYYGLAARASAKFALGDIKGAFEDGKKSFEIKPNDLALTVVGDAVYARSKSYDEAKSFWIGAYRLGDRDDGLIERLKKAGVPIPPPDENPRPAPK